MLSGSMAIGRNDDAYGWFGAFYTIPSSGFGDIKRIVSPQHRCVQQFALDYRRNAEACRHYDPFRQAVDPLRRKLRPNPLAITRASANPTRGRNMANSSPPTRPATAR
jgi:hypothetical protein